MQRASPTRHLVLLGALFALFAADSRAEILAAAENGFTLRHVVTVDAPRRTAYEAAVNGIGAWWSPDHTMSGFAENLYIDTDIPGCFCEILGEGAGLVHMTVTFVNPTVLLRFTGGLGPLGLMGVSGNMTWEFDSTADGSTQVTLQYAVGGFMDGGLDTVAGPVDGVLGDALARLKRYVETGSPEVAEE